MRPLPVSSFLPIQQNAQFILSHSYRQPKLRPQFPYPKHLLSTLTAALPAPQTNDSKSATNSQNGLYALNVKILASENVPVAANTVTLSDVSGKNKEQTLTDQTGTAHFTNLKAGVYDAVVEEHSTKVGETIINVSGQSHVIDFTINFRAQQNNPLLNASSSILGVATFAIFYVGRIPATPISTIYIGVLANAAFLWLDKHSK